MTDRDILASIKENLREELNRCANEKIDKLTHKFVCEMGRNSFVKNGGYDLENDTFTVQEFIDITKNAFGGDVIKQLEETIKEREG